MSEPNQTPPGFDKQVLFANQFIGGDPSKLFEALAKAQSEFKVAVFDKKAVYGPYASFKSVREASQPALSANGLSILQPVINDGNQYRLFTILAHSSGAFIKTSIVLILDKNNMQGLGSAITYAKRYAWAAMIGVVSDDDDDAFVAAPNPQVKTPPVDKKPADKSQAKTETKPPPAKPIAKNAAPADQATMDMLLNLMIDRGVHETSVTNLIAKGYGFNPTKPPMWVAVEVGELLEKEDTTDATIERKFKEVLKRREAAQKKGG